MKLCDALPLTGPESCLGESTWVGGLGAAADRPRVVLGRINLGEGSSKLCDALPLTGPDVVPGRINLGGGSGELRRLDR